jgi:hypothetical protein
VDDDGLGTATLGVRGAQELGVALGQGRRRSGAGRGWRRRSSRVASALGRGGLGGRVTLEGRGRAALRRRRLQRRSAWALLEQGGGLGGAARAGAASAAALGRAALGHGGGRAGAAVGQGDSWEGAAALRTEL